MLLLKREEEDKLLCGSHLSDKIILWHNNLDKIAVEAAPHEAGNYSTAEAIKKISDTQLIKSLI